MFWNQIPRPLRVCFYEIKLVTFRHVGNFLNKKDQAKKLSLIFQTYKKQGQLAYEGVKLVENCQSTFEAVGFRMDNEQDIQIRSVIKTKIATCLNSNKSNYES